MQDYHAEFVEIYNKNITRPGADRLLSPNKAPTDTMAINSFIFFRIPMPPLLFSLSYILI